jgi:phosphoribosylformimino-5-aminoimidazole carboxamide ribotide isomerase
MGGRVIVIPAIDLKDGKCVRLAQGDFKRATVYGDHPADVARIWQRQGAERIHVVDLDGSLAGSPRNRTAVEDILREVDIPVELGGGIRDMATIEAYIRLGVRWVILGTAAIRNEALAREACQTFPDGIILGIDAAGGLVAVQGWTEKTAVSAAELARRYEQYRIAAIVYTDISRDGMETGVNIEATGALAQAVGVPVIASGGVSGLQDIEQLLTIERHGVMGVIVGRSLYTGALSLEEAIRVVNSK